MAVVDVIKIAKVAGYLAGQDQQARALSGVLPTDLSLLLNLETKALDDRYKKAPTDATLDATANYVLALCGRYAGKAQATLQKAGTGGGTVVPMGSVAASSGSATAPVRITQVNFKNATQYDNATLLGKTLLIFWNDVSRFLRADEWGFTATGIEILVSGFTSTSGCDFVIYIY